MTLRPLNSGCARTSEGNFSKSLSRMWFSTSVKRRNQKFEIWLRIFPLSGPSPSPRLRMTRRTMRRVMAITTITATALPLPLARRGKVRDVYDLGDHDAFLFVATDRISAFDVVLSPGIPDKGKILNQISNFWFRRFTDVENHILESDFEKFPSEVRAHPALRGRSVIVKKCRVVPVECVARGYLVGSGLKEYRESGTVCGIQLEPGLTTASKLPHPLLTPR